MLNYSVAELRKTTIISHLNFNQQEISVNLFVFQYFVVSLRPKLDKQYNV